MYVHASDDSAFWLNHPQPVFIARAMIGWLCMMRLRANSNPVNTITSNTSAEARFFSVVFYKCTYTDLV